MNRITDEQKANFFNSIKANRGHEGFPSYQLGSLEGRRAIYDEMDADPNEGWFQPEDNPSPEERDAMRVAYCELLPLVENSEGASAGELRKAMPDKSTEEQDRALVALRGFTDMTP